VDECEVGGQICASGICCGSPGYQPVTYINVNRALSLRSRQILEKPNVNV
jgi:hypothetical protein